MISEVLREKKDGINTVKPLDDLIRLIKTGFKIATAEKCSLWGICPVNSGLYMKNEITTDLRFIIGVLWGDNKPPSTQRP